MGLYVACSRLGRRRGRRMVLWTQFRAALAENQLDGCIQLLRQLDDNPSNLKRHLRWDALQTLLQLCAQHGTVEEVRAGLRLYCPPAISFAYQ